MPSSLLPARWPVGAAPGWRVWGQAADFEAVDAVPARALSGDWSRYHPRAGNNIALQSACIELGAQSQRWELALTLRSDVLISGTRGAFDAVHAYKQRVTPADGSELAIGVREAGATWAGLRVARSWALLGQGSQANPQIEVTGALTVLSLRRLQRAQASGSVRFDAATGYGFDVQAQEQDSFRQFGGYGTRGARGSGASADLGLRWQPTDAAFINLSAVDLFSRVRIEGVSTEQLTASSATAQLNARGYIDYQPLISGRYLASDVDTSLSRKWSASAGMRFDAAGPGPGSGIWGGIWAGARWERVEGVDLPALWVTVPVGAGWRLQLDAESRFGSYGIGVATERGSLLLRTRSLPIGQSHAYGWQAAYAMAF